MFESKQRKKPRPIPLILSLFVLFASCWTAFAPTRVDPEHWLAPPAPSAEGIYAKNEKLSKVEWLARGQGIGPETAAIGPRGNIVTGYTDGRVVRISRDGSRVDTIAQIGGRPLGVAFDSRGVLHVAGGEAGLLRIENGKVESLAKEQGGVPFKLADDLDIAPDGTIYFSDASSKYSFKEHELDILEHRPNGRLLAWHPQTKQVELIAGGLYFANGVALAHDGQSVLVTESSNYRVLRFWIAGPKKGTHDIFAFDLPGFPDNITYSRESKRYWLALAAPRDSALDAMGRMPFLRKAVGRLPKFLQPRPQRVAQIVALDHDGKVIDYLEHDSGESYSPISSVTESGGVLYLGSYLRDAVGKIAAPPAR